MLRQSKWALCYVQFLQFNEQMNMSWYDCSAVHCCTTAPIFDWLFIRLQNRFNFNPNSRIDYGMRVNYLIILIRRTECAMSDFRYLLAHKRVVINASDTAKHIRSRYQLPIWPQLPLMIRESAIYPNQVQQISRRADHIRHLIAA